MHLVGPPLGLCMIHGWLQSGFPTRSPGGTGRALKPQRLRFGDCEQGKLCGLEQRISPFPASVSISVDGDNAFLVFQSHWEVGSRAQGEGPRKTGARRPGF